MWLKFIFSKGVITKNSNPMELVNFFEKIQIIHIHILVVTLKMTSCIIISKNKIEKNVEIQDSLGQTNFLFNTLPFSP
jgi:hypothetical protein